MANLTAVANRIFETSMLNDLPVKDNVVIYQGSAVSVVAATGYAQQIASAASATDNFAGFANATADNTVTGHTAGGINVNVVTEGLIQLAVTGATIASVGASVYASDGNTFTTTSTNNVLIGTVKRWVTGTTCIVRFKSL